MPITYPLTFPTATGVSSVIITPINVVGVTRSIYTLEEQVQKHQGQAWQAQVNLPLMNQDNAQEWIAFFLSLNGMQGTFLMSDPTAKTPRGEAANTPSTVPRVSGAGQVGNDLNIKNAPSNVSNYLRKGDYIQLDYGLHRLLADVDTSSTGTAALSIWPNLRRSPINNESVRVNDAVGIWRLASESSFPTDAAMLYELDFTCIEAVGFRTF